ncbi:MAG: hypothetical protein LRY54_01285 [Alphaproteobacteria bacterium]|nr:hypothetical protein [Alphaproteobacteria bacterium]
MKISQRRCIPLIAALIVCYVAAWGNALAGEARFFESLSDIPLMEGLSENTSEAYLFDKPEGRIAGTAAYGKGISPGMAENYYRQALPQFGWKPGTNDGNTLVFRRDGEELRLEAIEQQSTLSLHITVNPL